MIDRHYNKGCFLFELIKKAIYLFLKVSTGQNSSIIHDFINKYLVAFR